MDFFFFLEEKININTLYCSAAKKFSHYRRYYWWVFFGWQSIYLEFSFSFSMFLDKITRHRFPPLDASLEQACPALGFLLEYSFELQAQVVFPPALDGGDSVLDSLRATSLQALEPATSSPGCPASARGLWVQYDLVQKMTLSFVQGDFLSWIYHPLPWVLSPDPWA